jgi:hypothetical protein
MSSAQISCNPKNLYDFRGLADFPPVTFVVVLIGLAAFFVPGLLVRSIAKRLILGKTAHADPNGFFLRLYLKRSLVGFEDFAH